MKLALLALLLFPAWSVRTQTEVVVEPGQDPALIPIEGMHRGDHVKLEISSVSAVNSGIVALTGNGQHSYAAVCFRQRITQADAECDLPSDSSAIIVEDARKIRIRTNKVAVTLYSTDN